MDLKRLQGEEYPAIGYYDPYGVFKLIEKDILAKLPLRNLHWRFNNTRPLKTINELPIRFVEEIPKQRNENSKAGIYTRFMIVQAESIDKYRSQTRPLIKEWLKAFGGSDVEWAIICILTSNSKDLASNLIRSSFFDKLKTDFGANGKELISLKRKLDGKERCIKLKEAYINDEEKSNVIGGLMLSLKEFLLSTFSAKLEFIESKIIASKLDDKEVFLWNMKVARLFSDIRLYQDSLVVLDNVSRRIRDMYESNTTRFDMDFSKSKAFTQVENFVFLRNEFLDSLESISDAQINYFDVATSVFTMQAHLLELLACQEDAISVSAKFFTQLFRKLGVFAGDISRIFGDSISEWVFQIIEKFSASDLIQRIVEKSFEVKETEDSSLNLDEFLEFKAELILIQRDMLRKIARSSGLYLNFHIGQFDDISIDDVNHKKNSKSDFQMFSNQEDCIEKYKQSTEKAIAYLSNTGRLKTVDILSIDLALLRFAKKDYQGCLNILQDSYKYYLKNEWNYMGLTLQDIYLKCLEKLEKESGEEKLNVYLHYLGNLITKGKNRINFQVQNLAQEDKVQSIYERILQLSKSNEKIMYHAIDDLFCVRLNSTIQSSMEDMDSYLFKIDVTNCFPIEFFFESIKVTLVNENDVEIIFEANDKILTKNSTDTINLFSSNFVLGFFKLKSLEMKLEEKLRFVKYFEANTNAGEDTVIYHEANLDHSVNASMLPTSSNKSSDTRYFFSPDVTKFWCDFEVPEEIELNQNVVALCVHGGRFPISNMSISITSSTKALAIDEYQSIIENLNPSELKIISIPYRFFGSQKSLTFKAVIDYTHSDIRYSFEIEKEVDMALALSVFVQDIFKSDFIYSKFQIGKAIPNQPIRIKSIDFTSTNENYQIRKPKCYPTDITIFEESPATFFYKLVPNNEYRVSQNDKFDLNIAFNSVHKECAYELMDKFKKTLLENGLMQFWFVIDYFVLKRVRFNLDIYVKKSIIEISNEEEIEYAWRNTLSKMIPQEFLRTLNDAFTKSWKTPFTVEHKEKKQQNLHISVPVPILEYLQKVGFEFVRKSHYKVGESIPMKLTFSTSMKWSCQESADNEEAPLGLSSPSKNLSKSETKFLITVQNDDNWFVSGLRTQCIEASKSTLEPCSLELSLVPLVVGKIRLPKVFVKPVVERPKEFSMDIELLNGIETLLVVPDVSSLSFTF